MEGDYTITILVTFFAFVGLAALLLMPVYRFLKREEATSEYWTKDRMEALRDAEQNPVDPDQADDERPTA
jgi:membrane protein implicated in regulation of membrane protease activity